MQQDTSRYRNAMLDVDHADDDRFIAAAAEWLIGAASVVAPHLWMRAQQAQPFTNPQTWDEPHGAPGAPWGNVHVWNPVRGLAEESAKMATRPLSPESLNWLVRELNNRPVEATVSLHVLNSLGLPDEGGENTIRISLTVDEERPTIAQLQMTSSLPLREESGPESSEASSSCRWAAVVRDVADRVDPTFGHICDDLLNPRYTGRDTAGGRRGVRRSIRLGREILRGYSWVTVVPRELADSLGGAAALRKKSAFSEVIELKSGAVWLRAAEAIDGYNEAAMEQVFRALAVVLPKGEPKPNPGLQRQPRLIWRDAAHA
ncbi:hypothetical protein V2W30_41295 (plasmid) [Streptomyces sp. Q6]|uniref:Uncharacterized protein n=1 Tax=Streptomyces citrinus TaxID=3118173 RepID=A0ACD5ARD5_9ACTN